MQKLKGISLAIFSLVLYIFLSLEFSALVYNLNLQNKLVNTLLLILGDVFIAFTLILIYLKDFKKDYQDFNKNGKNILKKAIKVWFIGLIIMVTSNLIINSFVNSIASNEAVNRTILDKSFIYAIVTMVLIAPICEEIIFRLSLSKFIDNDYLYYTLSGLLFGYMHIMSATGLEVLYIIPYSSLGVAFAYIYRNTKNIFSTISVHIMHNLLCIILILL